MGQSQKNARNAFSPADESVASTQPEYFYLLHPISQAPGDFAIASALDRITLSAATQMLWSMVGQMVFPVACQPTATAVKMLWSDIHD